MSHQLPYQYIFNKWTGATCVSCLLPVTFIICLSIWAFTGARTYTNSKGKTVSKLRLWAPMCAAMLLLTGLMTYDYIHNLRIKKYGLPATGTLTRKYWHSGKNSGWRFAYQFKVKEGLCTAYKAYCARRAEEDNAAVGYCYFVLYDSTDPGNAFIDLHEPMPCNSDINIR